MELASRIKLYENQYDSQLLDRLPIIVRLDGVAFHSYTKGCKRPFDSNLHAHMVETTRYLVKEFHPKIGYTQSDEISLLFWQDNFRAQTIFGGRVNKINSVMASAAASIFNQLREVKKLAKFDCRCFCVPNAIEAVNYFLWRTQDAVRNSVQMAAQSVYSHKELHGKHTDALHDMLHAKGINWNSYPPCQKEGSWTARRSYMKGEATRHRVEVLDVPPFNKIMNKTQFLFEGAIPLINQKDYVDAGRKWEDAVELARKEKWVKFCYSGTRAYLMGEGAEQCVASQEFISKEAILEFYKQLDPERKPFAI